MRVPGLGRLRLKIARKRAKVQKADFEKNISSMLSALDAGNFSPSEFELVCFCGGGGVTDLIKCMLSFVQHVGVPKNWYLYSDGEIDAEQKKLFGHLSFVVFRNWDQFYENEFGDAAFPWTYKKYVAFAKHPYNAPSIFCDSDVLFYPSAKYHLARLKNLNYVTPEPPGAVSVDPALTDTEVLGTFFFNAGFFIVNRPIDFSKGFDYLRQQSLYNTHYFSDQSALNIVIADQKQLFAALDPRLFVVTAEDQFKLNDCCDYNKIAMRHFVGPVRHKMWK